MSDDERLAVVRSVLASTGTPADELEERARRMLTTLIGRPANTSKGTGNDRS